MEGLFLLLLLLLGRKPGGSSLFSSAPATGPSAFPPVPASPPAPVGPTPSVQTGAKWRPYHPLNGAVIARAEQLLHDSTMRHNDERIEPDPGGSGVVRYLKLKAPAGKVSVTAWKPVPGASQQAPSAAPALVPASYHPAAAASAQPGGRTLRRGMSGSDVAQWQRFLGVPGDGKFGPATEAATKRFQSMRGLTPDGVVGPNTKRAAAGLVAA